MSELARVLAEVAATLEAGHVRALASTCRTAPSYSLAEGGRLRAAVPGPHHELADLISAAWSAEPAIPGAALGLALEAGLAAHRTHSGPSVEVVVTGPDSPVAPVRLTSEVVGQLIDQAKRRVTLVSYAAYQLPRVIAALDAAVARGVTVGLILESAAKLDGGGGAHVYGHFRIYHWPIESRQPPEAKLHAKAVVVDNRDVLLTSANMTSAAYDKNIELGVLCRGGGVADRIQRHFDGLIANGVLVES